VPTVFFSMKPCYVCGAQGRCPDVGGPGSYHGPRDLDTRQSAAQRSAIYMWVQRCTSCGYCAVDISQGDPSVKAAVKGEAYRRQISDTSNSETANSFLCRALLLEQMGDLVEAGWACVYAAWVSDDSGFDDSGALCRARAVQFFQRARSESMPFAPSRGEEAVLLVDLMRRARQAEDARKLCEVEHSADYPERIKKILTYEMDLLEDGDSTVHTEAEAMED